ncbi:phage holin family protein [Schumannella soli]|uniref:Phage holin family protein n=1 Tax=Schumannella soli TaxID=2590779 RepID=A0A506Y5Q1_9MICO|nr:phage holin family protein [Schumannella soli]TPW77966.1 phage holin family protein [Schumannella soli]
MTDPGIPRSDADVRAGKLPKPPRKPSLVELVSGLPGQVTDLVHHEIELVKAEMIGKLKALGIGGGLLLGAVGILLFMLGVLLTAAVLGLSETGLPGWASALIIAGVLLIAAALVALIGWRKLKGGIPPIPTEAIDSLQRDLRVVKGIGRPDQRA